jgi:hypothetical protein
MMKKIRFLKKSIFFIFFGIDFGLGFCYNTLASERVLLWKKQVGLRG